MLRSAALTALLAAAAASPSQAASPKGECIKGVCKSQKKLCLGGFKTQFTSARSACGKDKQCKKGAKAAFKGNKKRCGTEFKTCKACCGGPATTGCSVAVCGDGNTVAGEACDDGGGNSNVVPDACRTNCALPSCGDLVVDSGEDCDPPAAGTCDPSCQAEESTTTTTTVTSTTSTTTPPEPCGNGALDAGEECDDGNPISTDGCTDACTICGNDAVTAPEECDDTNLTNGDGCDANCTVTGCGNGVVTAPETCDDGNVDGNDDCPGNCVVELCDPLLGSDRPVDVQVTSGGEVAALTVFLDYPEGKVRIPGSGGSVPLGIITDLPLGSFGTTNDLDHAMRQVVAGAFEIPDGLLFKVHFENCAGASAPVLGDFGCEVLAASDASGSTLSGVTCAVAGLPTGSTSTTGGPTTTTTGATTSTTAASTTTTTAASSTTTTGPPTTTTTIPALCGNGTVNPGESCDDGNHSDNDACPADCVIDACTPVTGTSRPMLVRFTPPAGVNVGGITVLLDYPEGQVEIPGPPIPGGTITNLPAGTFPIVTDLDHVLRVIVAIGGGNSIAPGTLFRVNFRDCSGTPAPTPAAFGCTVLEATDPFSNPVGDVTCEVAAP
jgi:cysteine-rich repeat protein